MLDIKFIRENPDAVKENIKKKFQEAKLPLVDQLLELDKENRAAITEASELRSQRNSLSKQVGMLMGQAKKDPSKLEEAEAVKAQVKANAERLAALESKETGLEAEIHKILLVIPNIIDPSVRMNLMSSMVCYLLYLGRVNVGLRPNPPGLCDPQYHRSLRAHRARRQRQRGAGALRRTPGAGL